MSDTPSGPDWWQASDGKWYPPEQHPDNRPGSTPPPYASTEPSYGSSTPYGSTPPPYGSQAYGSQAYGSQAYGQPQYSQTYGQYGGYSDAPQTSSKATVALVLAIVSFVVCPVIPAIVALVFASQATKEIRESGGRFTGQGLVTASRIIAIANLVLSALAAAGLVALIAFAGSPAMENVAETAQDRSAQFELETSLDAANIYFQENDRYPSDPFELSQIEPNIAFDAGSAPSFSTGVVTVEGTPAVITMSIRSDSGECFYVRGTPSATSYASDLDCGAFADQSFTSSW